MEFRDLKKQYQMLKNDIDESVIKVMESAHYIMGQEVGELEQQLADYVGRKHCISCANGTDALSLAMMAGKVGRGDAVFVPDFTFFSTAEIVAHIGATPVMVDVDSSTFNISIEDLENRIKEVKKEGKLIPKVIIPVDLFGLPADYERIEIIAKENELMIVEDGAQGFGGSIGKRKACSFGDMSTTSFFPAKPLGCYGDGGAVFTDDDNLAEVLRSYRIHGKGSEKYDNVRIGVNSRLDTIQAAILIKKLQAFKEYELDRINVVARMYSERLENDVDVPVIPKGYGSSWAQYTIKLESCKKRDGLKQFLAGEKIPSMVYYPRGMHQQTAFTELNLSDDMYPVSSKLCKTVLSLPIHPYMENEDIEKVCKAVKSYIKNN